MMQQATNTVEDIEAAKQETAFRARVRAAFLVLAPYLPVIALSLTALLYVADQDGRVNITVAVLAGLFVLAFILFFARRATPERANSTSFRDLDTRRAELEYNIDVLIKAGHGDQRGVAEAKMQLRKLRDLLQGPGERWVWGTGYLDAWIHLHRGEEALLSIASAADAWSEAKRDIDRLEGSSIPEKGTHIKVLGESVKSLEMEDDQGSHWRAIVEVVRVRGVINGYRDGKWAGVITSRNFSNMITTLAGLLGCVLLTVAIISIATRQEIATAIALYVTGTLAGLASLVYNSLKSEATVNDFDLFRARVVRALILPGLAGIAAAVLIPMFAATVSDATSKASSNDETTTAVAEASAQSAQTESDSGVPSIRSAFDLDDRPMGLALAFIFGIAPEALLAIGTKRTETLKEQLSSSSEGGSASAST